MKKLLFCELLLFFLIISFSSISHAANYTITNITQDSYDDMYPQISGNNVVWVKSDQNDDNIYFFNGTTRLTTMISTTSFSNRYPVISGSNIAWIGYDNNNYQIYLYSNSSVSQITNISGDDSLNDSLLKMDGDNLVWMKYNYTEEKHELYRYNIASNTNTAISLDFTGEYYSVQMSGNNVVWYDYDGNDNEMFLWNGTSTTQITSNNYDDAYPQISGNNIVWPGYTSNKADIFLYNGSVVTQITDNTDNEVDVAIDNNMIAWERAVNDNWTNGWEIYYSDGQSAPIRLTDDSYNDLRPVINDGNIIWAKLYNFNWGEPAELWFFDGSTSSLIDDNLADWESQKMSGGYIVYQGFNENNEKDIFLVEFESQTTIPEPASVVLLVSCLVGFVLRRARKS